MSSLIPSVLYLLAVFAPAASAARAEPPLSGAYSADIEVADVKNVKGVPADAFLGKWTLTFNDDGTYSVQQNGVEHVKGTFSVKGETLTLVDRSGDYACMDEDTPAVGEYRVQRSGKTITLTKVKDETCPGRAAALTLKPYTAEPR
jgi:hypothetical protein